jgi:hypothetical protein
MMQSIIGVSVNIKDERGALSQTVSATTLW